MFRVFDIEKHEWLKDNVYMSPDGELFKIKQSLFGMTKIPLDSDRYIFHESIGLADKNDKEVYVGDYIEAHVGKVDEEDENGEDRVEIGIVVYAHDLSSYIIMCENSETFYTLGSSVSTEIAVIGNVFDGYEG